MGMNIRIHPQMSMSMNMRMSDEFLSGYGYGDGVPITYPTHLHPWGESATKTMCSHQN
ncbi:hypothetical protein Sjap_021864 [Stephania japonica]|uniref:Uncharacterized protein n=1 Tax=Stephania japonica TaxID=461633 RepID=A0AAP0EQX3_9MAGN